MEWAWKQLERMKTLELSAAPAHEASDEAYATLVYGSLAASFVGLKVLIHSLRSVDQRRTILVLTPHGGLTGALSAADRVQLTALVDAFPRVQIVGVPPVSIFRNLSLALCDRGHALNSCGDTAGRSYMFAYSKLAVFSMTNWRRIILLDNDLLINRPLEVLWSHTALNTKALLGAVPVIYAHLKTRGARGMVKDPVCRHVPAQTNGQGEQIHEPRELLSRGGRFGARFSTGVLLVHPSRALGSIIDGVLEMARRLPDGRKNACHSEQTLLNELFVKTSPSWVLELVRCLPQSMNCRNPFYLSDPDFLDVREKSGCETLYGDKAEGFKRAHEPYILHFACGDKPWINNKTAATIYGRRWLTHLRSCDALLRR